MSPTLATSLLLGKGKDPAKLGADACSIDLCRRSCSAGVMPSTLFAAAFRAEDLLAELLVLLRSSDAEPRDLSMARWAAMIACTRELSGSSGSDIIGCLRRSLTDELDLVRLIRLLCSLSN